MKFKNYFTPLVLILLLALSGCKGGTAISDRRVPVINQQYLDKEQKRAENHSHYNKSDESYYAFNSYQLPVSYFEEKPAKEVFHDSHKKLKKKKPTKIYRKLPRKIEEKPHQKTKGEKQIKHQEKKAGKKVSQKNIVKVKPKEGSEKKIVSYRGIKPLIKNEDSKQKVKISKSLKSHSESKVGESKKVQHKDKKIKHENLDPKKPRYDPIEWPRKSGLLSKLELEKDIAYLEQDIIKKETGDVAKLKPKTPASKAIKKVEDASGLDTYNAESKPIPLPFK